MFANLVGAALSRNRGTVEVVTSRVSHIRFFYILAWKRKEAKQKSFRETNKLNCVASFRFKSSNIYLDKSTNCGLKKSLSVPICSYTVCINTPNTGNKTPSEQPHVKFF